MAKRYFEDLSDGELLTSHRIFFVKLFIQVAYV